MFLGDILEILMHIKVGERESHHKSYLFLTAARSLNPCISLSLSYFLKASHEIVSDTHISEFGEKAYSECGMAYFKQIIPRIGERKFQFIHLQISAAAWIFFISIYIIRDSYVG